MAQAAALGQVGGEGSLKKPGLQQSISEPGEEIWEPLPIPQGGDCSMLLLKEGAWWGQRASACQHIPGGNMPAVASTAIAAACSVCSTFSQAINSL